VLGSHVAGYTAAELSAAAAVPLGTMKSHIRAGLRRLESVAA
jgi:DNA-directed RNA polymerase specialized sigma24 family protein